MWPLPDRESVKARPPQSIRSPTQLRGVPATLSLSATNEVPMPALQTQTLFISAGHSSADPGAAGNGHTEADIVLEFRDLLADYLRRKVVFARDGEKGQNLPLRTAATLAAKHDIAVEFHCNAFSNPAASGVETLSKREHYPLAESICKAVSDTLGIPNRGAKGEASGQHSRLAFISQGNGIIVELFFITNKSDLAKYIANRGRLVKAVGDVLVSAVCTEYAEAG